MNGQRIKLAGTIDPEVLTNKSFRVTALRAIMTEDGRDLTQVNLTSSLLTWPESGLTSFLDHRMDPTIIGRRSAGEIIGVASEPIVDGDRIQCRYDFLSTERADQIRTIAEELIYRRKQGLPIPNLGISPDATFLLNSARKPIEVVQWHSLDVVYDPATGAGFEEVLREALSRKEHKPIIFDMKGAKQMNVEELTKEIQDLKCQLLMQQAMTESDVIQADTKEWIQERMTLGSLPSVEDVKNFIAKRRERYGLVGSVQGHNQTTHVGPDGYARLIMAAADMWNIPRSELLMRQGIHVDQPDSIKVERLMGIRELYLELTGDREGIGKFRLDRLQFANVTTTTFNYLLQDAINIIVEQTMSDDELGLQWYAPLVYRDTTDNIETIHWVRVDSFDAAPTVSEGDPYLELSWNDTEETGTFVKKGGYIGITLESILNNNGRKLPALARGIAQAALKAESAIVANIMTANATSSGSGVTVTETGRQLMNPTEGNIGTTALSIGQFWTISNAMAAFAAAGDSSYRLAASNRPNRIVVPTNLVETATIIVNSQLRPQESGGASSGGNLQSINAVQSVHPGLQIVECPEFADANDYYCIRHSPPLRPAIVLMTLRGNERPQVFAQDQEQSGSLFTNDEYRYKVRHWICAFPTNWRQFYGSVVA